MTVKIMGSRLMVWMAHPLSLLTIYTCSFVHASGNNPQALHLLVEIVILTVFCEGQ